MITAQEARKESLESRYKEELCNLEKEINKKCLKGDRDVEVLTSLVLPKSEREANYLIKSLREDFGFSVLRLYNVASPDTIRVSW